MIGKSVPDELKEHLSVLRIAMGRGLLSAMLGAGFSFNAKKKVASAQPVSWEALGKIVETALYTLQKKPAPGPKSTPFDPTSVLKMAQEYKELASSMGAKSLDDLIYENTSYEDFDPGLLHQKLLSLHWSDLFTTNYDRLLERAQEDDQQCEFPIIHKPYNIIRQESELPLSKPTGTRRIIKLHGSFPDVKPFLLAQDDYDTYPVKKKVFVQAVQNALVHETFCLIGFSGTDPNFRSWVEWVGKELAGSQPKLYLISFQEPTPEEVSYYRQHNIIPVNITSLTGSFSHVTNEVRQTALNIFLDHLKVEFPEEPLWSYKDAQLPHVYLPQPIQIDIYCEAAAVLRAKRQSYPGWVFPPLEVLRNAERFFVLGSIPNFPRLLGSAEYASNRLVQWLIAYEYLWAYDMFCIPPDLLGDEGVAALEELLRDVWPLQFDGTLEAKLKELPEAIALDRIAFALSLQNAACILISLFRRYGKKKSVTSWQDALRESLITNPNVDAEHWSQYNSILWSLENCDPIGAESLIAGWRIDDGALYWKTRKANLLAECGKIEESQKLLRSSRFDIREQIRRDGESAYLLSCEAWTERFLEVVNQQIASRKPITSPSRNESTENDILSRTPVLRRLAFHPFQILQGLGERLRVLASMQRMDEPELDFFSGKNIPDRTFISGFRAGIHDTHMFFSMLEKTGLPSRIDDPAMGGRLSTTMWIHTATVLFRVYGYHHPFIFPLVHRMLELDVFKKDQVLFSRYALANMLPEEANQVFDLAIVLLSRFDEDSRSDKELRWRYDRYMRFLLQYVSRLSLRLDNARLARLLNDMHRWYTGEVFFYSKDATTVFLEAFTLVIKSTPMSTLKGSLPSLMLLPLIPAPSRSAVWQGFSSPIKWPDILAGRDLKNTELDWDAIALRFLEDIKEQEKWLKNLHPGSGITPANAVSEEIGTLVNEYLQNSQSEIDRAQKSNLLHPYWYALVWLKKENLLTGKSISKITGQLWTGFTGTTPEMPGFRSFASCLYFPASDQEQCFTAHKQHLFTDPQNPGIHNPAVWLEKLGDSPDTAKRHPLSSRDLEALLTILRNVKIPGPSGDSIMGRHDDPSLLCIISLLQAWGVSGLKRSVQLGQDGQLGTLSSWLEQLREFAMEYGYSTAALDVLRLEFAPERSHELAETFRTQLFTGPMREETGKAVLYWKYYFSSVVPFPKEYDHMVADCFQNLALPEGMQLLRVLHEQLDGCQARFSAQETTAVIRGLRILLSALHYDIPYSERFPGDHPDLKPFPLEIPYHREQVAHFLKSVLAADTSLNNNATVCKWIDSIRQDPLADIRYILL